MKLYEAMNNDVKELKNTADYYIDLLKAGAIEYDEAVQYVQPYIDAVNKKAEELAKKHGVRAKKSSIKAYMRWH